MTGKNLFPVFEVPVLPAVKPVEEQKYRQSAYFDFDTGDFKRDGANRIVTADGREAYMQWCRKVVLTERFTCLAYSTDIGVEFNGAKAGPDPAAVESAVEKTINEALMINPKTEYVRDFKFSWRGDSLSCSFCVKGKQWEEQRLGVTLSQ